MLTGTIEFPGLDAIRGGEMLFTRGPSPSSCLIRHATFPDDIGTTVGELKIKDSDGHEVVFVDACIQRGTLREDPRSEQGRSWSVQILDRRYRWAEGSVVGDYNQRMPDGSLVEDSKRNPQELAAILLEKMGEAGYSVGVLPVTVYPRVQWNGDVPAYALERLANLFGCTIVLGLDNRVRLVQIGQGAVLDVTDANAVHYHYTCPPSKIPDGTHIHMGEVRWQLKWLLEAVGKDTDGSIKPINQLSYMPSNGWSDQWWCSFADVAEISKPLAHQTVWRWFRIKELAGGGLVPPLCPFDVTSISQFLPLENRLLKPAVIGTERYVPEATVEGAFWSQGDFAENTATDTPYPGAFRLLGDLGIVEFEYPVVFLAGGTITNPVLYLTASCRVQQPNGEPRATYAYDLPVPTGSGPPIVARHPELSLAIIQNYTGANPTSLTTNQNAIDAEALVYATRLAIPYEDRQFQDMTFLGVVPQELDGAVAQIQWRAGIQQGCSTRVSRMQEFSVMAADTAKRRRRERTDALLGSL